MTHDPDVVWQHEDPSDSLLDFIHPTLDGHDEGPGATQPGPVCLGPQDGFGQERISGWWHPSARADIDEPPFGVLICNALGREEECSHASLRVLATQLAEAGIPTLRFDYPGCGDSGGDEFDPDTLGRWARSVHRAADGLCDLAGTERVVLMGLRAGALLAVQAAAQRDDVLAVVTWMPVLSGRNYLRELRLLAAAGDAGLADPSASSHFEAGGLLLSADAATLLSRTDLRRERDTKVGHWLVLERNDLDDPQGVGAWADSLRQAGVQVDHLRLPGYVEMMQDPHQSQFPALWSRASVQWLQRLSILCCTARERSRKAGRTPPRDPARRVPPMAADLSLTREAQPVIMGEVIERAVRLQYGAHVLFGVVSEPFDHPVVDSRPKDWAAMHKAHQPQAVLLLNAGATRHTGPSRLNVLLARRLARQGHTVLRIDLAGLGESAPLPGSPQQVVYMARASEQIRSAVDFLRQRTGGHRVELVGLCSGAYHALLSGWTHAVVHPRGASLPAVSGVLAINPLVFRDAHRWQPGSGLSDHQAAGEMQRYRSLWRSGALWRRLLQGEVNLLNPLRVLGRQMGQATGGLLRDAGRRVGLTSSRDLGRRLEAIATAHIRLRFVFSVGDPGEALLRAQAGSRVRALERLGRLEIQHITDADHTFTRRERREQLVAVVQSWLQRTG
ncbi:hypothetical protein C7444_103220 [Sphaerotilus hippei]|uniref:Serine aminopeptidase S33 family n=1 Tax=Sphaerotilus hippei TaxID=744406 RepID=A0A318H3U1_9BURK|nr:hypothetical protein [Sphaerotilus hippei]PXW98124.1 hypothetical protein C7444_103220 [Sphaerotilus hippei]